MNRVVLSSVIDIISGGTPKTNVKEYWNGDIGWLSVTDFNNDLRYVYDTEKKITALGVKESNTKFLKKGDIIISARGTVGALAQIGTPMCFNQSCFGIRGKKNKADTDFLYYALKNYVKNIIKRSQGSVFNTINLASFDLMEIDIPNEINSQIEIAKFLSDLDAKIELNNKINQELEAMAKTLYDYWFVQFDFPNEQGKPYKSSGGKMVYNQELKREIPEGWEDGVFEDIGTIVGGSTPSKAIATNFSVNNSTPWITPKDLSLNKGNKFITRGEFDVTEKGIRNASLKIMPKGTVLLSSRAPIGYLAISREFVTTNQGFKSFEPNKGFSTYFIYYTVKNMIPAIINNSVGSTFKEISGSTLKSIKISLPSKAILNLYDEKASSIFEKQNLIELENQQLAELRDWLLPMLMNGQVTVKEAQEKLDSSAEFNQNIAAESKEEYKM